MKTITLSKGQIVMVDDSDFEYLNQFNWCTLKGKHTFYAFRMVGPKGKRTSVLMHREILNAPKGMECDHVDGNGLNNQRSNLRLATISQNRGNHIRKRPNATSKFIGVSLCGATGKWVANIQVNKKYKHLGSHCNEIEAAKAYDAAALEHFKEFACPNFQI